MTAVDTEPLAWDPLDAKYKADPHAIWKRMRDEQPLYYKRAVSLLRGEPVRRGRRLQPRPPRRSAPSHGTVLEMITADPIDMQMMIFMDPPSTPATGVWSPRPSRRGA